MLVLILFVWLVAWLWTQRENFIIVGPADDVGEKAEITFVKESAFPADAQTPIGTAFSSVSKWLPNWSLGVTSAGLKFVEVNGVFAPDVSKKILNEILHSDSDYVDLCKAIPEVAEYIQDERSKAEKEYQYRSELSIVQSFVPQAIVFNENDATCFTDLFKKAAIAFKNTYAKIRTPSISYRVQFLLNVPDVKIDCGKVVVGSVTSFVQGYQAIVVDGAPKDFYGKDTKATVIDYVLGKFLHDEDK